MVDPEVLDLQTLVSRNRGERLPVGGDEAAEGVVAGHVPLIVYT